MKTLFSIGVLVFFGIIAYLVSIFALNIAGLPGSILAGEPEKRTKSQFVFGSVVSAIGQSFVYLIYTAFIVKWTLLVVLLQGVTWSLWIFAFLAVMLPLWILLIGARVDVKESEDANPQTEALHITFVIVLVGFFVFAFSPYTIEIIYGWVPFIASLS